MNSTEPSRRTFMERLIGLITVPATLPSVGMGPASQMASADDGRDSVGPAFSGPVLLREFYGNSSKAHRIASERDVAVDYGVQSDGGQASEYGSIYGAATYRRALASRLQAGHPESPTMNPNPVLVVSKVSSTSTEFGSPKTWDQTGYFSIRGLAGGAYRAALTGTARGEVRGSHADFIGVHARAETSRDADGRFYGLWCYVNVQSPRATAGHAAEMNGSTDIDRGYGNGFQLIRLAMADNDSVNNRFSSAIQIGRHGGTANNGFYTGLKIDSGAVVRTPGKRAGSEAIRVDGASDLAAGHVGGIRLTAKEGLEGVFKYGLRMDEASFLDDHAILLGEGQELVLNSPRDTCHIAAMGDGLHITADLLALGSPDDRRGEIHIAGSKVLGRKITGWSVNGTSQRRSGTPTLSHEELRDLVLTLLKDLMQHGLIGGEDG